MGPAYQLWIVELMLAMALILAGTFNPLIERRDRRGLGRVQALVLLFIGLIAVAAGAVFLTIPPLVERLTLMVQNAPATRTRLIAWLGESSITMPLAHVVQNVELTQTATRIEAYLLGSSSQAVRMVGYAATTLVLSFYLLADGKRTQGVAYAIVPRENHMRLARILQNLETIVGGYLRGQLITSTAIGVFTLVLLVVCQVPNAVPLAVFAAVVDVTPFIMVLDAWSPGWSHRVVSWGAWGA